METQSKQKSQAFRLSRLFDGVGIAGFLLILPVLLDLVGLPGALTWLRDVLGVFGERGFLLLLFLSAQLLAALFGSADHALPVLAGLLMGALTFGSVFDIPYLREVRRFTSFLPLFGRMAPSFIVGALSIVAGNLLGYLRFGRSSTKAVSLLLGSLIILSALQAVPGLRDREEGGLSVREALAKVYQTLGREYKDPQVEAAVQRILKEKNKSLEEKERALEELALRLRKAEEDRVALTESHKRVLIERQELETRLKEMEGRLKEAGQDKEARERALKEAETLRKELENARAALRDAERALQEARNRVLKEEPLLVGRDYAKAVQPKDPVVRDFAVQLAKEAPGAFDEPQGSRIPSPSGLRQLLRIHRFVSGQWKYVSDPNVNWFDYASPAKRTIALGLAGDCDDYAILLASLFVAIGARARIVHGYMPQMGHAWTEVWMGPGKAGEDRVHRLQEISGLSRSFQYHRDSAGGIWLITDWEMGKLSVRPNRIEIGWSSE